MLITPTASCGLTTEDIQFVCDLAAQSGVIAREMRSSAVVTQKTGPRDLLTSADIAVSELLVRELRNRFPSQQIVSEEDASAGCAQFAPKTWFVDPIDGTENYVANDGMYSVMIGQLVDGEPTFGVIHNPTSKVSYVGTTDGAYRVCENVERLPQLVPALEPGRKVRVMMGNRDREQHAWVNNIPDCEFVYSGSVGLRVALILEGHADLYIHLAGKLKTWDTVGPVALALAGGLEVGSLDFDSMVYTSGVNMHDYPVFLGRPGALSWIRSVLNKRTASPLL